MNVTQVIVGHNEKKEGQGWLLRHVRVSVADSEGDSAGSFWMFLCHRYASACRTLYLDCTFVVFSLLHHFSYHIVLVEMILKQLYLSEIPLNDDMG